MGRQGDRPFRGDGFRPQPFRQGFHVQLFGGCHSIFLDQRKEVPERGHALLVTRPCGGGAHRRFQVQGRFGQARLDEGAIQSRAHVNVRPAALERDAFPVDQLSEKRQLRVGKRLVKREVDLLERNDAAVTQARRQPPERIGPDR